MTSLLIRNRSWDTFTPHIINRPTDNNRLQTALNSDRSTARSDYSTFDIFRWLDTEAQKAFVAASRRRFFPDGSRIYSQSKPGTEMYRISSGYVRMSVLRQNGREALYLMLKPGDCFGFCSLADGAPRYHTTIAKGDVEVRALRRDTFASLQSEHSSFCMGVVGLMSCHVRLLSEYLASSTVDELSCRIAKRLLLSKKCSVINGSGAQITAFLSQREIALMVGASRQAVNKVLRGFQDDGIISTQYGRVQILDIDRLQQAAA